MFESALLSTIASARRSLALPLSIAAHAAVLAALLGASLLREEEISEPPAPITFVSLPPAPPPRAGSPAGEKSRQTGATVSPRVVSIDAPASLPSARPLPELDLPGVSTDGTDLPLGSEQGVPGGTGDSPGGTSSSGQEEAARVVGGDVGPPELLRRVEPDYPESARKIGLEGLVILQAVIGQTGQVEELRVVRSVSPLLDQAAALAVGQWRYRPATLNGRAVRVYLTVTVNFRLR